MNERFLIRLTLNGKKLPVNSLSSEGVMLQKETDASQRGFMLEFDADAPGIEYRVERIRRLRGWPQWDFKLHSFVRDGMLGFSGVEPESLPDGRYWFRLRLADLVVPKRKFKLTIPKDGEVIQSIDVKQDPRRIEQADFSTMDAKVRTIWRTTLPRWMVICYLHGFTTSR